MAAPRPATIVTADRRVVAAPVPVTTTRVTADHRVVAATALESDGHVIGYATPAGSENAQPYTED